MPTTIQKILKPTKYRAVDTSGNNNHGEIHSGRALEFDGLADHLTVPDSDAAKPTDHLTCACWVYIDSTASSWQTIYGHSGAWSQGIWLSVDGSESIKFDLNGIIPYGSFGTPNATVTLNTWQRIVWTFTRTGTNMTGRIYVNGELITEIDQDSAGVEAVQAISYNTGDMMIGGVRISDPQYTLNGKLSDFQLWHKAWTQSDVTYDYLNPESLALNNSGTSLTESNLKLWYPMQDGHRGQQSYILDGANTGARELLPTIYQTSSDESASNWGNNNGSTVVYSESDGGLLFSGGSEGTSNQYLFLTTSSSSGYANLSENLEEGQTYKLTVDIKAKTGTGGLKIYGGTTTYATTGALSSSSFVTKELFWNHGSDTVKLQATGLSNGEKIVVNNISIKAINTKHHATTSFLGEELLTDGTNFNDTSTWDFTGADWTSIGTTAIYDGDGTSVLKLDKTYPSFVEGRTYRLTINSTSGTNTKFAVQDGTGDDTNILIADATYSTGVFSVDFVAPATTDGLSIVAHADSDAFTLNGPISVKEVGVTKGWTEADQQLDIPQTALQSYNQLAWFDGYNDNLDITEFDFTTGQTINMWVNPSELDNYRSLFGSGGTKSYMRYYNGAETEKFEFEPNEEVTALEIDCGSAGVIQKDKWTMYTFIWNTDRTIDVYLNAKKVGSSSATNNTTNGKTLKVSYFGRGYSSTPNYFQGAMTEISHYTDILTQSEINDLYNDGKAKSALEASGNGGLSAYWRNNGLAQWDDLKGSNHGTITCSETILIPEGVDASRDTQGFIMNRQKTTNLLNLYTPSYLDTSPASNKESPYVYIPKAPLMTNSTAVTNFSICSWIKFNATPSETGKEAVIYDDVQEYDDSLAKGLKFAIGTGNAVKCDVWWGERNDSSNKDRIYCNYDLDNIDEDTITNPHSFDANGMWNGTQTSMGTSKGIDYDSALMNSGNLPRDQWLHLAVTFDHDNSESQTYSTGDHTSNNASNITNEAPFYIYVNGILVGKEGLDSNDDEAVADNFDKTMMGVADHPAILGSDMQSNLARPGNNAHDTWGYIDDLLIYSDTLTSREVLRIYNAGKRSHKND